MISRIPTTAVWDYWPKVEEWLRPAIEGGGAGEQTVAEVKDDVLDGRLQLWCGLTEELEPKYALVTRIVKKPAGLTCIALYAGGHVNGEGKALASAIESFARSIGIKALELHGRRGWERTLGLGPPKVYVYRKEL